MERRARRRSRRVAGGPGPSRQDSRFSVPARARALSLSPSLCLACRCTSVCLLTSKALIFCCLQHRREAIDVEVLSQMTQEQLQSLVCIFNVVCVCVCVCVRARVCVCKEMTSACVYTCVCECSHLTAQARGYPQLLCFCTCLCARSHLTASS